MPEKPLSEKELDAIRIIRNAIMHRGEAPSVRELQMRLNYRSPRSAAQILERLQERGIVARRADGKLQLVHDPEQNDDHARTVDVPLVGTVPCGAPLMADENVEAFVPVSVALAKGSHRYFLLRAQGDSMDRTGISDRDLVLVRQQRTGTNGDRVVALVDAEATIKEFYRSDGVVVLKPNSTNDRHQPILLTEDFQIQGVVVAVIPRNFQDH